MAPLGALLLLLLPLAARAQFDPASALAIGVAGKVAGVLVDKARDKYNEESVKVVAPCTGEHCCVKSSCMDMPGMHCNAERGPTTCAGSNAMQMQSGMCACLSGPCSQDGKCGPLPPGWTPTPALSPSVAPALAPQPAVLPSMQAQTQAPTSPAGDDFDTWHTGMASKLYAEPEVSFLKGGATPQESFLRALAFAGVAGLLVAAAGAAARSRLRHRGGSSEEASGESPDEEFLVAQMEQAES